MKKLVIIGAGGYGRELLQWCREINEKESRWEIIGFLDDNPDALNGVDCDVSVIGVPGTYNPSADEEFVVAVANPAVKKKLIDMFAEKGASFASVIHPDAKVGSFNEIGKGVVLYPGARIIVNAKIGDFVTILDLTTVGHDAVIGAYSTVCGSCGINGHVEVGECVFVGSHVTVAPGRKIGDGAYVGGGSVVVTNVKAGTRVLGNPARKFMM